MHHHFILAAISAMLVVTASCRDSGPRLDCEPDLTAFLRDDISAVQQTRLEELIKSLEDVKWVDFVSKHEAYERMRELFKDNAELVESIGPEVLPASFRIELHDPSASPAVEARLASEPGIDEIMTARAPPDTSELPRSLQPLFEGLYEPC